MPAVVKQKKKNKRKKESLYNSGESDDIKEIAHKNTNKKDTLKC